MKTHANLFEQACSFEELLAGYQRARRGKRYRPEVARFSWRVEAQLLHLRDELLRGTYAHGQYRTFIVADSKRREIKAAPFRDRVLHQSMHAVLEPLFDRGFIHDSYACRVGKGTHAGLRRFEQFARASRYVLTMDISKYFASVDHAILLELLARKIRDPRMFALCRLIIAGNETAPGRGIAIGNLTSQLFANVYLNELDQYAKRVLGLRRYIRYMDDIAILHDDKNFLHETKERIRAFVGERLALTVHPHKVQVMPTARGVEFLGYRVFPHHRLLRKSTVMRFVTKVRRAKKSGGGGQPFRECSALLARLCAPREIARPHRFAREAAGCAFRVSGFPQLCYHITT